MNSVRRKVLLFAGLAAFSRSAVVRAHSFEAVPSYANYDRGDVRHYGAVLDGVADDTKAIQAWVQSGGELSFPVAGTARITDSVQLHDDTHITGTHGAVIHLDAIDRSCFVASGRSGISIQGLHIRQTGAGTAGHVAAVFFESCRRCRVSECEIEGMQWAGVLISRSEQCEVRNTYFHDWVGGLQDAADVCVYRTSRSNIIDGNRLEGGGEHGILCQDPYLGEIPKNNVFSNNQIGPHTGYGIAVYCPGKGDAGDSFNEISNNRINGVRGSFPRNRASGTGIYVVGKCAGGTLITGNQVSNCCIETLQRSLAPGGIGINGIPAGITPVTLRDNVVEGMTQGDGIVVVSSAGGCGITGGSVNMPDSNDGSGPGGGALQGCGIRVDAASHVRIEAVTIRTRGPGPGLFVYANGIDISDIDVIDGEVESLGNGVAMRTDRRGAVAINNLRATGTKLVARGGGVSLQIAGIVNGQLSKLEVEAQDQPALRVNASQNVVLAGGSYTSRGPVTVEATGDCEGSRMEDSVKWGPGGKGGRRIRNLAKGFDVR